MARKTRKTDTVSRDLFKFSTREEWLNAAVELLKPRFDDNDTGLPEKIRVSVSFPYGAARNQRVVGQHFPVGMSNDQTHEIVVHPRLDDPMKVLGTLTHELCHAAAPEGEGHGPKFAAIGTALLLEGKPTSMGEGEQFIREIGNPIVEALGPYPHAALHARHRKQTTRMIKCECTGCGYIARVSSGTLAKFGAPLCPNIDCDDSGEPMQEFWNGTNP